MLRSRRLRGARGLCGAGWLCWLGAWALLACASAPPSRPQDPEPTRGLARIARTGEMRVGTTGEQPPLTMTARNGELIGLDVALTRVLARSMGVEARFVRLPFHQLLEALEAGQVDLVVSGMTITPARSLRVLFVGPYYTSGKSILVRSGELAGVQGPEDLDRPDLRIAALAGSTSESFVRGSMPRARLMADERIEDAIQHVVAGQADLLVADRETCDFAVLRFPDAGLVSPPVTFTIEPMGIALHPDETRLARMIQSYLKSLEERGALQKARDFWFRDSSWVGDVR